MSRLRFAPAERATVRIAIAQSPELESLYVRVISPPQMTLPRPKTLRRIPEMQMVAKEFASAILLRWRADGQRMSRLSRSSRDRALWR